MKNKKALIARIARNLTGNQKTGGTILSPAAKTPNFAAKAPDEEGLPPMQTSDAAAPPRATGTGKQAAFWLDDEDRAIFHETGMLLYTQGIKPSHNLVLRAAIRMVPRDHRLVEKVRELIEKDGRKLRHQKG